MRSCLKFIAQLLVAVGVSAFLGAAWAGSYEDWFRAIKRDDASAISALLRRGFDPNTVAPDGQHGLYLAIREPSPRVTRALLDWPTTRVDARNRADETALMMAALKGQSDVVKALLQRDADVNKPGWTPLHYAATGGHPAVMRQLLDAHAYIDAESPNGTTPLMMAAQYGSVEAVQLLLEAGADPALKNQLGLAAGDFARRAERRDVEALIARHQRTRQAPTQPLPPARPPAASGW